MANSETNLSDYELKIVEKEYLKKNFRELNYLKIDNIIKELDELKDELKDLKK